MYFLTIVGIVYFSTKNGKKNIRIPTEIKEEFYFILYYEEINSFLNLHPDDIYIQT
jgi:hypothetical protein